MMHPAPTRPVPLRLALAAIGLLLATGAAPADTALAQPPALRPGCADTARVRPATSVRAFRATGPIRIDGVLDEIDWQRPSGPVLVQNEPDNGCPPRQKTDWWVVYDDEALYIGTRMWDSAPDSIVSRLGRRDSWPESDWLVIVLDTFNDDRTGYLFGVNPAGAIGDATIYNDGWDDPSWDGIWQVATRVDGDGWTAEFRLPFAQLNYPDRPEQVWGINFSRRILRYQEREDLYFRPREEAGAVRRYPDLVGISGIARSSRRELLVYGAGRAEYVQAAPGDPFNDGSRLHGATGADLRWGLTNQLTLNATVNPDFGQVEVDPAVVNLSDFETFFEERRPFFVEQANLFLFGREGTSSTWNFSWTDPLPFYSRRIGRAPQLGLDAHDYADAPGATTILGAAKLSGRIGRTDIGLLTAVTAREQARLALGDTRADQLVEPGAGYSVLRLRRARDDGRSGLGVMLTGVRRDLADPLAAAGLTRSAQSAGLDG
ncbi:MAG: carbohydrate binding family 9 domain-containing protein, partial [Candidatus Krumholzibacteriia bacterium]